MMILNQVSFLRRSHFGSFEETARFVLISLYYEYQVLEVELHFPHIQGKVLLSMDSFYSD